MKVRSSLFIFRFSLFTVSYMLLCLLMVSCGHKQAAPNPAVPVNLYTVKKQVVLYYDLYPANTVALSQVNLYPEVQGYITGIYFTEGSHVYKGQKLYGIDERLYQEAYDEAKATLEVDKGNVVLNQQDVDRYTYLNKQDAIAKQTLDHTVIALQQAENTVKAAEEAMKIANTNLTFSDIYAPFSGTIGISQVRLGNMVTVGQTLLNIISTDDSMGVDFFASEKTLSHFEQIKKQKQNIIDSLFTIRLPDDSLYPYSGKIKIIDRAVDPETGTIHIRVSFPNPGYSLKPGMSCVLRVHNQDKTPQLVVPNKAVVELMGEYFVYVAKDSLMRDKKDSAKTHLALVAIQTKVQLGQVIPPNIIIKSGITEGTRIVVDGIQSLHTGSLITAGKPTGANSGQGAGNGGSGFKSKNDSSKKN